MENRRHYLYEIKPFSDGNGNLAVIEECAQIPFKIKRIFYEYGLNKTSLRGKHANRDSKFCFIAVSGSCAVIVDDGHSKTTYRLNKPNEVLFLNKMLWKTMTDFSKDCVLLVLSDCLYNPDEYIRNYLDYCLEVKND